MSYLIKIIVWLSTVVIAGYLGCGLAIAGDDKQQDKQQQTGVIVQGPSSSPFDLDIDSSKKIKPDSTETEQN